ncbi:MAG: sigma-54 dependent transcriptional regulator [Bacteroidota bacterium]
MTTLRREHVLVVDDDKAFRLATSTLLEDEQYTVTLAANGREALELLKTRDVDLVLSDLVMATMTGIELLKEIRAQQPRLPVIMVTGFGSIDTAVEAMQIGAIDYLTKPVKNDELILKIRRALAFTRTEQELEYLRKELQTTYNWSNMISRSPLMKSVIQKIQRVADTDVTVLVRGESGTGKELVAKALHYNSIRNERAFVVVNCSAIPEALLESELFGHERGAFTGATRQRRGKFEEANGGTLFLDEIGDISATVQTKLLRVLQEKSFEKVGGNGALSVDVRVVAATNRDLEGMVEQGQFRSDLYYRLNVFPITLPALRERMEDIPLLVDHFLDRHKALSGGNVLTVSPLVISQMMRHSWHGNIRELENLVKRAILTTTGTSITALDLPGSGEGVVPAERVGVVPDLVMPFKEYLAAITQNAEEQYLRRAVHQNQGNVNQVARLMAVDRKTVYRKMSEYGIKPEDFRE